MMVELWQGGEETQESSRRELNQPEPRRQTPGSARPVRLGKWPMGGGSGRSSWVESDLAVQLIQTCSVDRGVVEARLGS